MAGHGRDQLELITLTERLLQGPGQGQVKLTALPGKQIVVESLPQQRVTEAEALILVGDQNLGGQSLAQCVLDGTAIHAGHRRDRGLGQRTPHGHHSRDTLGTLREALDPGQNGIAQTLRRGTATVEAGHQELLGVERIALAARVEPLH